MSGSYTEGYIVMKSWRAGIRFRVRVRVRVRSFF